MFTLLHKIQVDHQGTAGACDGSAFSTSGDIIAASDNTGLTKLFNVADGELSDGQLVVKLKHNTTNARALPGDDDDGDEPNVEAVEWSTDSKYFFTGGTYDGIIRAWRVADWSLIGWVQGQEYSRQVETLSMSQDNILAAGGDEGAIYLYQFNSPVEKKLIRQEGNNPISIEAEDFDANVRQGCHWWAVIDDKTASGYKKVQCFPDVSNDKSGVIAEYGIQDVLKDAPKLDYRIHFSTPGLYYIWARGQSYDHYGNSFHVGMNGKPVASSDKIECLGENDTWIWDKDTKDKAPATIEIVEAGPATINVWPREDGIQIDKLVLILDPAFQPVDDGPEANPRK